MNAAARSPWESSLWVPVSLVLAILVLVVARSHAASAACGALAASFSPW
jgi:hypothetical protein